MKKQKLIRLIALIGMVLILLSCSKTIYVPIENVRTEYKDRLQRDSILIYDSVFVKLANDTVWMEKYRYAYRDKLISDSIFISDTIQIPYPVVEYKEVNKLKSWQSFLIWNGIIFIASLGLFLIVRFFRRQ